MWGSQGDWHTALSPSLAMDRLSTMERSMLWGGFIRFPGQCVFKQPLHIGGDFGHGADNRVMNGGFDKCFVLIHSAMLHS